jgi:hypothetical protein
MDICSVCASTQGWTDAILESSTLNQITRRIPFQDAIFFLIAAVLPGPRPWALLLEPGYRAPVIAAFSRSMALPGPLEKRLSRRSNFWIGVIVLAVLGVAALAVFKFFLHH